MGSQDANLDQGLENLNLDNLSGKSKQGIRDVVTALLDGAGDAKLQAAKEVRRLTKTSSKNRVYLAAAGVLTPLVSMLRSSDKEAKEAAMLALLNLAVQNERNKVQIVKAGAIAPLVEFLGSESVGLRESAAVVVLTLSASNANKPIIGHSGATPLLVEMLNSGSLQGKVDAVLALYNLSTCPDNLAPIFDSGAIPPLIALLKDCKKASKVAEKISALLESLTVFEEGRSAIANEEGGILALVEVLEEGSLQGRDHAVSVLLTMCQSSRCKYRQAILQEGVIPGLLELTVQGTAGGQEKARNLLQLLRETPEPPRSASAPAMLESLVYDIASHVDNGESGKDSAKKMLTEMVQMSMEQSMRHLQQRAMVSMPTHLSR